MTPSPDITIDHLTDRPAPYFPGLRSVQAIGANPAAPDVTIYRRGGSTVAHLTATLGSKTGATRLLLRMQAECWDIFSPSGDRIAPCFPEDVPAKPDTSEIISVDRELFLDEARTVVGDPGLALLACAEGHAGASAADHSNFKVVCRRMNGEASPADLEQIYLFDSRKWPCRVTGVFANVAKLSPEMQDTYLDRVK